MMKSMEHERGSYELMGEDDTYVTKDIESRKIFAAINQQQQNIAQPPKNHHPNTRLMT
jgi:hypothetical protein